VRKPERSQWEGRRRSGSLLTSLNLCPPRLTAMGTASSLLSGLFSTPMDGKECEAGGFASPANRPPSVPPAFV
jgi:hypothetical protein